MLHSTYAWLLYTFTARTLHTWCFFCLLPPPLSLVLSLTHSLWCRAEYKPHVHESETSISCQFMRRLWIIKPWQPGTRNERRGDKMGRMRKEIRNLFTLVVLVCARVCMTEYMCICMYLCLSHVCVWACTDIVLTWRTAPTAVLIWWLGNILEFVYLFIQLQVYVCVYVCVCMCVCLSVCMKMRVCVQ